MFCRPASYHYGQGKKTRTSFLYLAVRFSCKEPWIIKDIVMLCFISENIPDELRLFASECPWQGHSTEKLLLGARGNTVFLLHVLRSEVHKWLMLVFDVYYWMIWYEAIQNQHVIYLHPKFVMVLLMLFVLMDIRPELVTLGV